VLILDGRLQQKATEERYARLALNSTRTLAPVNVIIEEIRAASLIQVKRRSRTVALCFP